MTWCCCRQGAAYSDISEEEDVQQTLPNAVNERTPLLNDKNGSTSSTGRSTPSGKESSIRKECFPRLNGDSYDEPSAGYPDMKVVTEGTTPVETFGTAPQDWSASDKDFLSIVSSRESSHEKRSDGTQSLSSLPDADQPSPPSTPVNREGDEDSLLVIAEDTPLYKDYLDAGHKVTSTPLNSTTADQPNSHMEEAEDLDFSLPERPTSALQAKAYSQTVFLDDTLTDSDVGEVPAETTLSDISTPEIDISSSTKPYRSPEETSEGEVWASCEQNNSNVTLTDNDSTLSLESPGKVKVDLYGQGDYCAQDIVNTGAGSSVSSSPSELWKTVSTDADGEFYTSCSQEPIRA